MAEKIPTTDSVKAEPVPTVPAPTAESSQRRHSTHLTQEQQKALERHLEQRPDVEQLMNQNILKEGGRLAASRDRLEREMRQNALGEQIGRRSSLHELQQAGIMPGAQVAPALQATARQLEKHMRASSLSEQLASRDELADLERSGVMRGSDVAPRLRGAKVALEHAFTRDRVGHLLEGRPDEHELIENNILRRGSGSVSSRLAGVARDLEHQMTVDRVGHLLEGRSSPGELEAAGLLQHGVAPALQGAQRQLQHNLNRSNLYHALRHRPSISELEERGLYIPADDEVLGAGAGYSSGSGVGSGVEPRAGAYSYAGARIHGPAPPSRDSHDSRAAAGRAPPAAHRPSQARGAQPQAYESGYQRRSKVFHLTRILLKYVASMAEAGEISLQQKGFLKDLIVDQDPTILSVAENFDVDNDLDEFKDSLIRLADRRNN